MRCCDYTWMAFLCTFIYTVPSTSGVFHIYFCNVGTSIYPSSLCWVSVELTAEVSPRIPYCGTLGRFSESFIQSKVSTNKLTNQRHTFRRCVQWYALFAICTDSNAEFKQWRYLETYPGTTVGSSAHELCAQTERQLASYFPFKESHAETCSSRNV